MATKTVVTKSGKTIKVELVRHMQDKIANLDGDRFVTGRELVEYTNICFFDDSGKVIAKGSDIAALNPKLDAKWISQGAVGRVDKAFVPQSIADQITAALAELDAENPKSDEQVTMEQAKAEAHACWESEVPAMMAAEAFDRKMNREDSDY